MTVNGLKRNKIPVPTLGCKLIKITAATVKSKSSIPPRYVISSLRPSVNNKMNINTIGINLKYCSYGTLDLCSFWKRSKGYSNAVHEPISIENNRVPVLIVTYVNESAPL